MKRPLIVLMIGLLAAVVAYCGFYLAGTAPYRGVLHSQTPELFWLKKEFNLSEAEFARISQLHAAYRPHCMERCRRIAEQDEKLRKLLASAADLTPQIENVLAERAKLRAECESAMLRHFFEVSHTMPPEQGKRYLAWVQEKTFLQDSTMSEQH
ncbi:MAG: hypothetical protein HY298_22290 [Verrucomicrobia bacterium]|nr:hypothetical protein [Verrucomicrobiota bacterium]